MKHFIFILLLSPFVRAETSLEFNYVTNDGGIYMDCVHEKKDTEPDFYKIICGKGLAMQKNFEAKFRVRPINTGLQPTYELIYWVTDRNQKERVDYNSTVWLRLSKGQILDVVLHQDLENAYAALEVRFKDPKP